MANGRLAATTPVIAASQVLALRTPARARGKRTTTPE
jgi:hypothetical protein